MYDQNVITALANLRTYAAKYTQMRISDAINDLDNAGVFAAVDEQTGYASAEDVLAEHALMSAAGVLLHHEDRSYGYVPAADRLATLTYPTTGDGSPATDLARSARMIDSLRPKGRPVCTCPATAAGYAHTADLHTASCALNHGHA